MSSEGIITTGIIGASIIMAVTPILIIVINNKEYNKRTKKLLKKYKKNLKQIKKEFAEKKAELENTVKEYDERFAAVHQVLFDIQHSVIKNSNVIISDAERKNAEDDLKKFGDMIK